MVKKSVGNEDIVCTVERTWQTDEKSSEKE